MLKKSAALVIILSIMIGMCSIAGAQTTLEAGFDSRVLDGIELELGHAQTTRALVEMESGEVASVHLDDLVGATTENGLISLFYYNNNQLVCGRFLEPDLVKHYNEGTNGITPGNVDALAAGNEIGLDRLREVVKDSTQTITVAILDTGIDITHPWLQGRIVSPYDAADDNNDPNDEFGHGTHIAGIIAQNTPNNVKIMPIKVFSDEGDAPDSVIVKGIDYAVKHGANVINLSLGGYGTTSYLDKAIDYAISQGVTIVVSAGNDAKDVSRYYPAAFPEVVTVGATGENGDLLYFSNTGDAVDVCAPGEKIISSAPDNATGSKSGTSMASPLVASAAAMLLMENPARTPAEIEGIIQNNTCDLGLPGKDKLFGYGETSFGNYEINPDFYMIETSRELAPTEEKFNINLGYYAGSRVSVVDILIDGTRVREVPSILAGDRKLNLDIRSLAVGTHTLEVQPLTTDGSQLPSYRRSFVIPDYNVRIKVYDVDDRLISNPKIDVLGFSSGERIVSSLETTSVVSNGIWMADLDFERLSRNYDKIRFSVRSTLDGTQSEVPFYLRITGTGGEKIYETSECSVVGFTSEDPIPGCTVKTRILGSSLNGFDKIEDWGGDVYEADISAADIPFVAAVDDNGQPFYGGLFYYDSADLWLDVYAYSGGKRPEADENTGSWYYSGSLNDVEAILDLTSKNQIQLNIDTDLIVAVPPQYILLNIPTGDSVLNSLSGQAGAISIMPGIYDLFFLPQRDLTDGRTALDVFFNSFYENIEGTQMDYSFGKSIEDRFIYDSSRKQILHKWVDEYGNGYTVVVQGSGGNDFCMPVLTLTANRGGVIKIKGVDVLDAGDYIHGYSLDGVPDGIYYAGFINSNTLAFPVKPYGSTITVKNGEVYNPNNTPPSAFSDYTSDIRPGDLFVYDLYDEFSDNEQDVLEYSTSAGWIVDGMFFYRDLVGKDVDITITAYDGAGGTASFTHTIRVSDRAEAEDGYVPNPDIDSIGATSWAVPFVRNAILAGIVPVDLLDSYQSSITRKEFSALVVKMAEMFLGEITPAPGVSFKDTRDENILKAASKKFLAGSNGYFNPDEDLSRQQFCVIVYQAIKVIRPDLGKPSSNAPQFRDAKGIASWAKEAVDFCTANVIIVGSNGILNPTGQLSREQAILMLYKAYEMCK